MKRLLLCLVLAFTSCTTVDQYNHTPDAEKAAFVKQQVLDYLADPVTQDNFKRILTVGGTYAMDQAVSGTEREEIANCMWTAAVAFRSLATGALVSGQQLDSTLHAFNPNVKSVNYVKFINEENLAWQLIYSKLKVLNDPSLTKQYLLILADVAETVGGLYKNT